MKGKNSLIGMRKGFFIVLLILLGGYYADAQSNQKYQTSKGDEYRIFESDSKAKKKKKKARKSKDMTLSQEFDKKIEEYEDRMEANAKKYKRMSREMQKPQYADPSFFGHKNKPRKRKPGKKKFCKECQIVH